MGADLYINPIYNENHAKYQPLWEKALASRKTAEVKFGRDSKHYEKAQARVIEISNKQSEVGYFRDSYNGTAVMATLGLSWWRDVIPMLNKKSQLVPTKAKKLRQMILDAEQHLPTKEELIKNHCQVDEEGDESVEGWHEYYKEKRQRLLDFLDLAIKNKLPIDCSL